jgi:hypothetical protein
MGQPGSVLRFVDRVAIRTGPLVIENRASVELVDLLALLTLGSLDDLVSALSVLLDRDLHQHDDLLGAKPSTVSFLSEPNTSSRLDEMLTRLEGLLWLPGI